MTNNWFEGKNPHWAVKAHFLKLTFKLSFLDLWLSSLYSTIFISQFYLHVAVHIVSCLQYEQNQLAFYR